MDLRMNTAGTNPGSTWFTDFGKGNNSYSSAGSLGESAGIHYDVGEYKMQT